MSAILLLLSLFAIFGGVGISVVQSMRDDNDKIHLGAGLLGLVLALPFFLAYMSYSPVDAGNVGVRDPNGCGRRHDSAGATLRDAFRLACGPSVHEDAGREAE